MAVRMIVPGPVRGSHLHDYTEAAGAYLGPFIPDADTNTGYLRAVAGGTLASPTFDEIVLELVAAGDVGAATFKWTANGSDWYGRNDPNQATWLNQTQIDAQAALNGCAAVQAADGAVLVSYYRSGGSPGGYVIARLVGGSVDSTYEAPAYGVSKCMRRLKSGRLAMLLSGIQVSDEDGAEDTWTQIDTLPSGVTWHRFIELASGRIAVVGIDGSDNVVVSFSPDESFSVWTDPATAATATTAADYPDIVETTNGVLVVVYADDEDSDTVDEWCVVRSTNGGTTWGSSAELADSGYGDYEHCRLLLDIDGSIYAFARQDSADIYQFSRSTDHGVTWSTPASVVAGNLTIGDPCLVDGHEIQFFYTYSAYDEELRRVARGAWEAYASNACPCAVANMEMVLHQGGSVEWRGAAGAVGDTYTGELAHRYSPKNLVDDPSPSVGWRSTQDEISWEVVFDLGTNVRMPVSAVALFGVNFRDCDFQANDTDSWGAPSVDESLSTVWCTGEIDGTPSGNTVPAAGSLTAYSDHDLKGLWYRATNGSEAGSTWNVLDNVGGIISLDTTESVSLADTDAFVIFGACCAATFTAGAYRFIRLSGGSETLAEGDVRAGTLVAGGGAALDYGWSQGYGRPDEYGFERLESDGGQIHRVRRRDARRRWVMTFPALALMNDVLALLRAADGRPVALIPDDSELAAVYLVAPGPEVDLSHRDGSVDKYDLAIDLVEVL